MKTQLDPTWVNIKGTTVTSDGEFVIYKDEYRQTDGFVTVKDSSPTPIEASCGTLDSKRMNL